VVWCLYLLLFLQEEEILSPLKSKCALGCLLPWLHLELFFKHTAPESLVLVLDHFHQIKRLEIFAVSSEGNCSSGIWCLVNGNAFCIGKGFPSGTFRILRAHPRSVGQGVGPKNPEGTKRKTFPYLEIWLIFFPSKRFFLKKFSLFKKNTEMD
jgi:hypothetical protein